MWPYGGEEFFWCGCPFGQLFACWNCPFLSDSTASLTRFLIRTSVILTRRWSSSITTWSSLAHKGGLLSREFVNLCCIPFFLDISVITSKVWHSGGVFPSEVFGKHKWKLHPSCPSLEHESCSHQPDEFKIIINKSFTVTCDWLFDVFHWILLPMLVKGAAAFWLLHQRSLLELY